MLRPILLASTCALFASQAHAWTHGGGSPAPSPLTVTFGTKTLAGHGGAAIPGLTGPITIVSETPTGGGGATDYCVSTDYAGSSGQGQIVPSAATDSSLTCTSAHYGNAPHASLGTSYALVVRDNFNHTVSLTINTVANEFTVKSQYGFGTHGDVTGTNTFQLSTVLFSHAVLGDTILMRNQSGQTEGGITPELNPLALATAGYNLEPPVGGWTGSGRITITCETTNSTRDADGNLLHGGSCNFGALNLTNANQTTPYAWPVDFNGITCYRNHLYVAQTPSSFCWQRFTAATTPGSTVTGVGFYNISMVSGPNFTNAAANIFLTNGIALYSGDVLNGFRCQGAVATFCVEPIPAITSTLPAPYVDNTDPIVIENGVGVQLVATFIQTQANANNVQRFGNFLYNSLPQSAQPVVGDEFAITSSLGTKIYSYSTNYVNTAGVIPLTDSGTGNTSPSGTALRAACTVQGGGTIPVYINNVSSSTYTCRSGIDYPAVETRPYDPSVTIAAYNDDFPDLLTYTTPVGGATGLGYYTANTTYQTCGNGAGCTAIFPGYLATNTGRGASIFGWGSSTLNSVSHETLTASDDHTDFYLSGGNSITTAGAGAISGTTFTPTVGTWQLGEYMVGANVTAGTQITACTIVGTTNNCNAANTITVSPSQTAAQASISGLVVPLRGGGYFDYNISGRNVGEVNEDVKQFMEDQQFIGYVGSQQFKWNISSNVTSLGLYVQDNANPDLEYNTLLTDVESNAWNPSDPTYDVVANPSWFNTVHAISNTIITQSYGGGVWNRNLSSYFTNGLALGTALGAPWNVSSGSVVTTDNESIGTNGLATGAGFSGYPGSGGSPVSLATICTNVLNPGGVIPCGAQSSPPTPPSCPACRLVIRRR